MVDPGLVYFYRANSYYLKGNLNYAISDYDQAIDSSPNFYKAYLNRGFALRDAGEHNRALADFNKAITLNSSDAPAYAGRGYSYGDKGEIDQAISDFNKAISLNP